MDIRKIGSFIAERRKERGLTQTKLAEQLGVTNKAVSKWENGRCLPDASLFQPLSDLLGVSLNELLSGEMIPIEIADEKIGETIVSLATESQTVRQYKQLFKYFVIAVAIVDLAVSLFILFVSYPSRFSMIFVIILELLFLFCWSYLTYMERGSRSFQWMTLIACTILFVSAVAGIFALVWANGSIGITVGRRFIMNACFPCLLLFVGIVDRAGFTVSLLMCLAMSTIGMFFSSRYIRNIRRSSRQRSHRCVRG